MMPIAGDALEADKLPRIVSFGYRGS